MLHNRVQNYLGIELDVMIDNINVTFHTLEIVESPSNPPSVMNYTNVPNPTQDYSLVNPYLLVTQERNLLSPTATQSQNYSLLPQPPFEALTPPPSTEILYTRIIKSDETNFERGACLLRWAHGWCVYGYRCRLCA